MRALTSIDLLLQDEELDYLENIVLFFIANDCTGICSNWAWYYTQPGNNIFQPNLLIHTVLTIDTGNDEYGKQDKKTENKKC